MGMLIKNEFYKLKREWFMAFLLLLSLLPILTGGAGAVFNNSTKSLADLFFFMNNQFSMFFPMVIFILIGSLFYQEYKNKTYINWITYGFSKKKLFLSKVAVSTVISIGFAVILFVAFGLLVAILNGTGRLTGGVSLFLNLAIGFGIEACVIVLITTCLGAIVINLSRNIIVTSVVGVIYGFASLLEKPDVLLLDEPTNFLDKDHVAWLAEYLSSLENAFLVVSHDFDFLDKIANRICDIDNDTITKYYGTYSEFLRKKTLLREDYIRQYSAQQKEIKKTEEFIRKNIAGRKAKMARGRQKQLDRMDKMEALEQKEIIPHFHFPVLPLTNTEHLLVKHLAVGYHYPVLSDIDFSIKGGQKVVITGFNGIGKSTLLKTLIGQIPSMQGHFKFSDQVTFGYFEQDLIWDEPEQTPIQIVSNIHPDMVIKDVRKHLARCGISSKHAMQAIGTLSGGEQAKVKMCLLTLIPCNFLIMDEPTNHLDVQAKEALKSALMDFAGTVLLVSHEEAFYREWAQRVISVEK